MATLAPLKREIRNLKRERRKHSSEAIAQCFDQYLGKPVEFIEQELGDTLTNDQKKIAWSVVANKETNVPAGHGVGKTRLSALLVIYWVFVEKGLAISTAPTKRQVNELLWGEVRRIYDRHSRKLGGERGQTFLRLSESARAFGFTSRQNSSDGFQGIHADKLLLIEDEANGVSVEIDDGAMSCVTGTNNRILRIGNPTVAGTPFEKACQTTKLSIPVWNHPNVSWAYEAATSDDTQVTAIAPHGKLTGEHYLKEAIARQIIDPSGHVKALANWPKELQTLGNQIPGAVSVEWIEDKRKRKGEQSAFWAGRLNAEFPGDIASSIIPRSLFEAAKQQYTEVERSPKTSYTIGVDVGDGGDDTTIAIWCNGNLIHIDVMPTRGDGEDTERAVNWAWDYLKQYPGLVGVDKIGVGAGVLSGLKQRLRTRKHELPSHVRCGVWGVNFGAESTELTSTETTNLKSDWYWALREALQSKRASIAPLNMEFEERLQEEFSLTFYEETLKGKTQVESKRLTKKRLGHSPDIADAVVIGYGVNFAPGVTDARELLKVLS